MTARVGVYRITLVRDGSLPYEPVSGPEATAAQFPRLLTAFLGGEPAQECVVAIDLDARNRPVGVTLVAQGSLNAATVHPREVYKAAVLQNAASLILAHNHPSGDCTPSQDDRELCRRLARAGELLGISLLDFLILAGPGWYSFREQGLLPAITQEGLP